MTDLRSWYFYSFCRCFLNSFDNTGQTFKKDIPHINLSNEYDYIEAKIDLEPTNRLKKAKQNILSVGENIDVWSTSNDGLYNIHFYYPNSQVNDHLLRFSTVIGVKEGNLTKRTMGVIKLPTEIITIRISKYGISINNNLIERYTSNNLSDLKNSGVEGDYKFITEDDRPPNTYETFVSDYLSADRVLEDLQIGSTQGNVRSWAYYYYLKYFIKL